MEYYSAIKRNGPLAQAAMRVTLRNITRNKRSQTQKSAYRMTPFTGRPRTQNGTPSDSVCPFKMPVSRSPNPQSGCIWRWGL